MKKLAKLFLLAALLTPLAALPAKADRGDHRGDNRGGRSHYVNHYRGGNWHRPGWAWGAGYYPVYPAPVYGYYPAPRVAYVAPAPVFGVSFLFR